MNNNDGGTMYDFVDKSHTAPVEQPKRERTVGQFANRENMSDPYVNKEQPQHVKEAMQIEQKDLGYYEFYKFAFGHRPIDAFGDMVNKKFGKLPADFNFIEQRNRYMSFYKQELEQL